MIVETQNKVIITQENLGKKEYRIEIEDLTPEQFYNLFKHCVSKSVVFYIDEEGFELAKI
jgi:hypothetical protein